MPFGALKNQGSLLMSSREITLVSASGSFKICINKYKQVTREFFSVQCYWQESPESMSSRTITISRCKSLMIPYMSSLYIIQTVIIVLIFQWKHALNRSHHTLHCILNQIFSQCIVSKILKLPKLQFIANYNVWQGENTLLFKSLSSDELHLQNILMKQGKFINAVL